MNNAFDKYQKKIVSYLDGSLSHEENSEFEAFVLTHPEFEAQVTAKKEEVELLKSMIPKTDFSKSIQESLEIEMRSSIFNLLKEKPKTFFESAAMKWEEWTNR